MESKRQQKFSKVIQKELSDLFQKESSRLFPGAMVTITMVRVTPDLSMARVFLSIFTPVPADVLTAIRTETREIRYKLGKQIRNQVRVIPELDFMLDDSFEYASRMDQLFNEIHKKEGNKE